MCHEIFDLSFLFVNRLRSHWLNVVSLAHPGDSFYKKVVLFWIHFLNSFSRLELCFIFSEYFKFPQICLCLWRYDNDKRLDSLVDWHAAQASSCTTFLLSRSDKGLKLFFSLRPLPSYIAFTCPFNVSRQLMIFSVEF